MNYVTSSVTGYVSSMGMTRKLLSYAVSFINKVIFKIGVEAHRRSSHPKMERSVFHRHIPTDLHRRLPSCAHIKIIKIRYISGKRSNQSFVH